MRRRKIYVQWWKRQIKILPQQYTRSTSAKKHNQTMLEVDMLIIEVMYHVYNISRSNSSAKLDRNYEKSCALWVWCI